MSGPRICIVAYKDLRLNTRVARQARALAEAGAEVTVVAFAAAEPALRAEAPGVTWLETGIPATPQAYLWLARVCRLLGDGVLFGLAAAFSVLRQSRADRFAQKVLRAVEGRRFDVVQAHHDKALLAAAALCRRGGGRLVFDAVELPFAEGLLPTMPDMRALRRAEIKREAVVARRADAWITINALMAATIARRFDVPAPLVLRNCRYRRTADDDGRLRADVGLPAEARLVLYLNSIRPGEGLEVAVAALAFLPPEVHLALLGPASPETVAALRAQAGAAGVGERLHVLPVVPSHTLLPYAAGADIGLVPRQDDGDGNMRHSLPNRVLEMVASRLPLAVSRLPAVAELVRAYALGEVFDETDPADLARAVSAMLDPQRLRVLRDTVDRVADEVLNWETESRPYVDLLGELGRCSGSGSEGL